MSFGLSSLGCCLTLAVFGGVCLVPRSIYAQAESRPRRAIELSETNNAEVLTRLNQLTDQKEAFKEPESDWKKAFDSLSVENRSGPMPQYVPPRPAPIPNKRMKDLLERKRNWMLAPEDLLPDNSSEDWSEGNDSGRKNRNSSSLKQFSDAYDHRDKSSSKMGDKQEGDQDDPLKSPRMPLDGTLQDDPSVPAGIRDSAKNLKSWLSTETAQGVLDQAEVRSTFEDSFGFGNAGITKEQEKAQKSYIEKYQAEVLGGSTVARSTLMPNPLLNPLAPAAAPLQPVYSGGLESAASGLKVDGSAQAASLLGSALSPTAVPNLNTAALNPLSPFSPPAVMPEVPKGPPPAWSSMEFPRRRF